MKLSQVKKIEKLLQDIDIDIDLTYDKAYQDIEDFDGLRDYIEDQGGFNVEIIYNARAMEYLMEHDSSLQYSLGLAHDIGYSLDNLNSETLASILASQNTRQDFEDLEDEIDSILSI